MKSVTKKRITLPISPTIFLLYLPYIPQYSSYPNILYILLFPTFLLFPLFPNRQHSILLKKFKEENSSKLVFFYIFTIFRSDTTTFFYSYLSNFFYFYKTILYFKLENFYKQYYFKIIKIYTFQLFLQIIQLLLYII